MIIYPALDLELKGSLISQRKKPLENVDITINFNLEKKEL